MTPWILTVIVPAAVYAGWLDLKGARERLCRATTGMDPANAAILQGALDRIDLVACDLPQWSRHDGGRA